MKNIILFLLSSSLAITAMGGHLVGGEISYECLGGNDYRVSVIMYRDCNAGPGSVQQFDDTVRVAMYRANGSFMGMLRIPKSKPTGDLVDLNLNVPCLVNPPDVCVREMLYTQVAEIIVPAGGLTLVHQRCCRPANAINIINPSSVGSTYAIEIPAPSVVTCNSSPKFNQTPPVGRCLGIDTEMDFSATDPDGDSLVYEFCTPFIGGSGGGGGPGPVPIPPLPPPYAFVSWATGFSGTNQITSFPVFSIDANTGIVSGRPTQQGTYVFGICVSEYRNGTLLSTNKRDFQLTVATCDVDAAAAIDSTLEECVGLEIQFFNLSTFGKSFFWDFGDITDTTDTSTGNNPTWTYPDTGIYTIMLVAFGDVCSDTTYFDYYVKPRLDPEIVPQAMQCFEGNSFDFQAAGFYEKGLAQFEWDFGSRASPSSSLAENPAAINFDTSGTFKAYITIRERGCVKSDSTEFIVVPNPLVDFFWDEELTCAPYDAMFYLKDSLAYKPRYEWYMGEEDTLFGDTVLKTFPFPGDYDIGLMLTTDSACIDTVIITKPAFLTVQDTPVAGIGIYPEVANMYEPNFRIVDESKRSTSVTFIMPVLDTVRSEEVNLTYPDTGNFWITQIVGNQAGCFDTTSTNRARVEPQHINYVPNSFTPDGDGINDTWRPVIFDAYDYQVTVIDRWNREVWRTGNQTKEWDGKWLNRSEDVPIGVYFYTISCEDHKGLYWYYTGTVRLIR